MAVAMKMLLVWAAATSVEAAFLGAEQEQGNPCAERNAAGLVSDAEGTKKDVKCCLIKEKHDRCMECRSMNCAYKTCNVNERYYREHSTVMEEKASTKEAYAKYDQKAMEAAGWGS